MIINPNSEILDKVMGNDSVIQDELLNIEDELFYKVQEICKSNKLTKYLQEFAYITNELFDILIRTKFINKEMNSYKSITDEMKLLNSALDNGVQEIVFYGKDKKRYSINSDYVVSFIIDKLISIEGKEEQKRRIENSEMLKLIGGDKVVKKVISDWDFTRQMARKYAHYYGFLILISIEGEKKPSKDSIYRIIYDFLLSVNFYTGKDSSKEASIKKLMRFYKSKG